MSDRIALPAGSQDGVAQLLASRHSVREYTDEGLGLDEVAGLPWAGQGVTGDGGVRTAQSAHGAPQWAPDQGCSSSSTIKSSDADSSTRCSVS